MKFFPGNFRGVGRSPLGYTSAVRITGLTPVTGRIAGGAAVTITGVNFQAGATVTFGGVAATGIVVVDPTQITAVTPAHDAGAVDVTVVNPNGFTDTLASGFTYLTSVILAVTPNRGTIAGGLPVTLRGLNFLSGSTVTFGGQAATSVVWVDAEHIQCKTPPHAVGSVDVTVTEP